MDVTDWKLLKALSEVKSMSRAGEYVHLSQPAVVYRINRMEEEMETTLFLRSSKGVQLTSAGSRLLSYSNKMLFQNEQIKHYVKQSNSDVCSEIQIGASSVGINDFLSPIIKSFMSQYPHAAFSIKCGLNDDLYDRLQQEEIRIAIIRGNYDWNEGSISISEEPLMIIASEPINDTLLTSAPLISYQQGSRLIQKINDWYQSRFGCSPSVRLSTDHGPMSCIKLVKEGLGWAVVPALHIRKERELFTESILNTDGTVCLHPTRLLYYNYLQQFDDYAIFINFVRELFENN